MKIIPQYQHTVLSVPAESVLDKLASASKEDLQVLLAVFAETDFEPEKIASRLEMTLNVFNRSLEMWQEAGVLTIAGKDTTSALPFEATRKKAIASTISRYTSNELADMVQAHEGYTELLDSCQQVLGKIFNAAETSIIIGLMEQLSLSHEYILRLCTYASEMQKKNVRFVEKTAIDLYDQDITTYGELEEELLRRKEIASSEAFIRGLFGIGNRAFIKKEKDFIVSWMEKYKFNRDMIRKAYEITVTNTNDSSMSYANAILENWYKAGYKTPAEVDAADKEHSQTAPKGTSFATDDFYEAALQRSYENNT